jgi:hypothetical protein
LWCQRDAGDEDVRHGFGLGADVLRVGMRGRAEQRCLDRVGEERATADDGQEVKRCVGYGPYPSGRDEPSEKAFNPWAQRVDEASMTKRTRGLSIAPS